MAWVGTTVVAVGICLLGAGLSHDPFDRGLIVAGIWVIAVPLAAALLFSFVHPLFRWLLSGPQEGPSTRPGTRASRELEIIHADYHGDDVTSAVRNHVNDHVLDVGPLHPGTLGVPDTAVGTIKHLTVKYRINGTERTADFNDGDRVRIPMPGD